jgi:hypothetical protein
VSGQAEALRLRFAEAKAAFRRFWWTRLTRIGRVIAINLVLGLAAWGLLALAHGERPLENARDGLLRWELGLFSGTAAPSEIALIDIDDEAYFRWGSPLVTPRDKLCRLIDFAIRARASVVVVDVDLTSRDPEAAGPGRAVTCDSRDVPDRHARVSADDVIRSYLADYMRHCRVGGTRCIPVIFAVTPVVRAWTSNDAETRRPVLSLHPSFLDAEIARGPPAFLGSDSLGQDPDGVMRRWRPFDPVCLPRPTALLSVPLLAVAAYERRNLAALQAQATQTLAPICPGPRASAGYGEDPRLPMVLDVGYPLEITATARERQFLYRIGWSEIEHAALPLRIPAAAITDVDPSSRFRNAALAGTIVVIGGTGPDQPDFHRTPIGLMPGSVVLLNAINAVLHNDRVKAPSLLSQGLFELATIIVVAVLFAYRHAFVAVALSIALVAVAGLTVGVALLDSGSWIDPIAPVLGIGSHQVFSKLFARIEGLTERQDSPQFPSGETEDVQ